MNLPYLSAFSPASSPPCDSSAVVFGSSGCWKLLYRGIYLQKWRVVCQVQTSKGESTKVLCRPCHFPVHSHPSIYLTSGAAPSQSFHHHHHCTSEWGIWASLKRLLHNSNYLLCVVSSWIWQMDTLLIPLLIDLIFLSRFLGIVCTICHMQI